jgi:hypothetical protein
LIGGVLKGLLAIGFCLALIVGVGHPVAGASTPLTQKFSNCAELNKVYPGGVAKSSKVKNQGGKTKYKPAVDAKIYEANKSKDRDKDGIVCER